MNKDRVSGKIDQAKGKVKEKVGTALNDERMANSGVADQVKGAAKEVWGNVKDAARDAARDKEEKHHRESAETRQRIMDKTDEVKDQANRKIDEFKKSA